MLINVIGQSGSIDNNNNTSVSTTLFNGLCAFFNFDGNINDSSSNNLILGTNSSNLSYNFNYAPPTYSLSSVQFLKYGSCSNSGGFSYPYDIWDVYDGVTNASFSLWFNLSTDIPATNPVNGTCSMVIFGQSFGRFGFVIAPSGSQASVFGGNNYLSIGITNNNVRAYTTSPVTLGTWNHFAGVLSNTKKTFTVYQNGVQLSSVNFTTLNAPPQNYTGFAINGSGYSTSGEYGVPSRFSSVGLWNRELTPSEVNLLYTNRLQYPFFYINYRAIAGGGGGGSAYGAGGGAGGVTSGYFPLSANSLLQVVVGAGGTGGSYSSSILSTNGLNSVISSSTLVITASGGGAGGNVSRKTGLRGGSGGGTGNSGGAGGLGLSGQGNNGGATKSSPGGYNGGGGGAGSAATDYNGGSGIVNDIFGSNIGQFSNQSYWIGGGGGADNYAGDGNPGGLGPGTGGIGGGGAGATTSTTNGTAGSQYTGGGGGGSNASKIGGSGGSGCVILNIPLFMYSGDQNITLDGGTAIAQPYVNYNKRINNGYVIIECLTSLYYYHTYPNNTFNGDTQNLTYDFNYLTVAGGGGGGVYAGGGAGGALTGTGKFTSGTTYNMIVGGGGVSTFNGTVALNVNGNGSNSYIMENNSAAVFTIGGGAGATTYTGNGGGLYTSGGWVIYGGANGGSGGGSGGNSNGNGVISQVGGFGIPNQGYNGGDGASISCTPSGGGGGAGGPGGNYNTRAGGVGIVNPITGSTAGQLSGGSYYVAGGGAGATNGCGGDTIPLTGGLGGGGSCQGSGSTYGTTAATPGMLNTGGGGGGGFNLASGAGGSGVIVISVPTRYYTGITTGSPTVTTSGSNTILTFRSSGSYTA